jgi:hypothetical protein
VGPAGHTQINVFNNLQKGGDQKAALKPLSFLTRGHDHPKVECGQPDPHRRLINAKRNQAA